jgi:hypothetical protein
MAEEQTHLSKSCVDLVDWYLVKTSVPAAAGALVDWVVSTETAMITI